MNRMKEADLFKPVKKWLEERQYEVYTEVVSSYTNGRADIVAVHGPVITVIELKLSLSLELIGQAVRWKPFANYVYVAVPYAPRRTEYARMLLMREGIGLLEVDMSNYIPYAWSHLNPQFQRRVNDHMRTSLTEYHKELPGGHAGGGYITPYKLTIERVREFLRSRRRNNGWVSMKEMLDHCETHYMTPKSSLAKALKEIEHFWCEHRLIDGKLHFRYRQERG